MKRFLQLASGDVPRHDVDHMPLNLESQAITTRMRKRQKLRDTAVKLKPKKITPFLKTATPIASLARLPPGVLYKVSPCLLAHPYV